jgi:molybdopterin/thiamine biosynthesis adenylyltransferase/rhodanese-related sulfurtransferase
VDAAEALRLVQAGHRAVDVREPWEWSAGHVAGALHIPLADLATRLEEALPDREAPLLLYCRTGSRSGRAVQYLASRGYRRVVNLADRLERWQALGGPWEAPPQPLSDEQQRRYARQLLIPEIGQDGQRRLLDAKVLIVGAGGLGSPAALYLAAAGVGTIGLVDDEVVDESNLQRQVVHATDRVGQAKTASARVTLEALNPGVSVVEHFERMGVENVERLIGDYGVVVDGSDSFDTRYLLNDAAVRMGRPVVHASVYRWEGQVTSFVPFEGPCYRCLYPSQPPEELAPACSVAGVVGVLPGIAGMLQAAEVLKLLLGVGQTLAGRLLQFDASSSAFSEIRVDRRLDCPTCGEGARAAR